MPFEMTMMPGRDLQRMERERLTHSAAPIQHDPNAKAVVILKRTGEWPRGKVVPLAALRHEGMTEEAYQDKLQRLYDLGAVRPAYPDEEAQTAITLTADRAQPAGIELQLRQAERTVADLQSVVVCLRDRVRELEGRSAPQPVDSPITAHAMAAKDAAIEQLRTQFESVREQLGQAQAENKRLRETAAGEPQGKPSKK